ncbi:hypothetical protein D9M69_565680 [compost metagenome]
MNSPVMKATQIITVLNARPASNRVRTGASCRRSVDAPTYTVPAAFGCSGASLAAISPSCRWSPFLRRNDSDSGIVFRMSGISSTGRPAT